MLRDANGNFTLLFSGESVNLISANQAHGLIISLSESAAQAVWWGAVRKLSNRCLILLIAREIHAALFTTAASAEPIT